MEKKRAIYFSNVYKKFGDNEVLKGLSFQVREGEILSIAGHNGAGKTTTMRIIQGLLEIEDGSVEVFGNDPSHEDENIRKMTGVLSDDTGLYESLTVYDNLKFFSDIYGCEEKFFQIETDSLLEKFQMLDYKHKIIKDFSMGMKKKIAIIRTIFHKPKLVLMDEPMNGLDPVSRELLYDLMKEMREELGTTFVVTTHDLDAVPKFSDSIIIIKDGKSVLDRSLDSNYLNEIKEVYIGFYDYNEKYKKNIESLFSESYPNKKWRLDEEVLVISDINDETVAAMVKDMVYRDIKICEISKKKFDLEKIYIDIDRKGVAE